MAKLILSTVTSSAIRGALIAILATLIFAERASAHPVAQGAVELKIHGDRLEVGMKASLEQITVERNAAAEDAEEGAEPALEQQWSLHGQYILRHLKILADGTPLAGALDARTPPRMENAFVVFNFIYALPGAIPPRELVFSQNLLNEIPFAPGNPWEATYVVSLEGESSPRLLVPRKPLTLEIPEEASGKPRGQHSLFMEFLEHGFHHILDGLDHLLFVSALVLGSIRLLDVVKLIAAFTLAHTLTLALSALNIVRLSPSIVEPLISFSIVVVAIVNLFPRTRGSFTKTLALAFFFGLFHGLGFAGGLIDAMENLPSSEFWTALIAFSAGVEIGHQAVVLPLFLTLWIVRKMDAHVKGRAMSPVFSRTCSAIIACGGVYFLSQTL